MPRIYTKAAPFVTNPAFDWSGVYIGAHLGAARRSATLESDSFSIATLFGERFTAPSSTGNARGDGIFGGGHAGWNYQVGRWVLGPELSFSGAGAGASLTEFLSGSSIANANSSMFRRVD